MKSDIEAEIASAKAKLTSEDVDAINAAKTSLEQKTHKLAELLYQQAGADNKLVQTQLVKQMLNNLKTLMML